MDYKKHITNNLIKSLNLNTSCHDCLYNMIRRCKDSKYGEYQLSVHQLVHKCNSCLNLNK